MKNLVIISAISAAVAALGIAIGGKIQYNKQYHQYWSSLSQEQRVEANIRKHREAIENDLHYYHYKMTFLEYQINNYTFQEKPGESTAKAISRYNREKQDLQKEYDKAKASYESAKAQLEAFNEENPGNPDMEIPKFEFHFIKSKSKNN